MDNKIQGHVVPDAATRAAVEMSRVLRDLARARNTGLCQQPECQERATFVCATMLSSLSVGAASLRWNSVCVKHAALFAEATNTPRAGT